MGILRDGVYGFQCMSKPARDHSLFVLSSNMYFVRQPSAMCVNSMSNASLVKKPSFTFQHHGTDNSNKLFKWSFKNLVYRCRHFVLL